MHDVLVFVMERIYFSACLALGRLLRSARYSKTRIVCEGGTRVVRKRRAFHAPLLIWMGGGLMTLLDTGVRVLPRRKWEERERHVYRSIYGASADSIRRDRDGALIVPWLPGETLAALLNDLKIDEPLRRRMIQRAVVALANLHRLGVTHGDAMAENVMIDIKADGAGDADADADVDVDVDVDADDRGAAVSLAGAGAVARWFDFETVHESPESQGSRRARPFGWQRADDVRALLATCLIRTAPERRAETLRLVLDAYGDEEVTRLLRRSFGTILQRPLTFHLGQAPLSMRDYREIARLLNARLGDNVDERIVHEPDSV